MTTFLTNPSLTPSLPPHTQTHPALIRSMHVELVRLKLSNLARKRNLDEVEVLEEDEED